MAAYDEIVGVLGIGEPAADLGDVAAEVRALAVSLGIEPAEAPDATVDRLVELRAAAREEKDWARSDQLRDALAELGIVVEDAAGGSRWHRQ